MPHPGDHEAHERFLYVLFASFVVYHSSAALIFSRSDEVTFVILHNELAALSYDPVTLRL